MSEPLRLRMKLFTDKDGTKFMAVAALVDSEIGVIFAVLMNDSDTRNVSLTVDEWNAIPFAFFKEDGPAPRMEKKWDAEKGQEVP